MGKRTCRDAWVRPGTTVRPGAVLVSHDFTIDVRWTNRVEHRVAEAATISNATGRDSEGGRSSSNLDGARSVVRTGWMMGAGERREKTAYLSDPIARIFLALRLAPAAIAVAGASATPRGIVSLSHCQIADFCRARARARLSTPVARLQAHTTALEG